MDDLSRAFAMERRFDERLSTRIEPFTYGTVFLDEAHPDRFVSNFLKVEGDLDAVDPEELIDLADEILGGADYAHRSVLVRSEEHGARWRPVFEAAGYRPDQTVLMCLRREPDRSGPVKVLEVTFAEARPLIHETYVRDARLGAEHIEEFTDQHGSY